MRNGNVSFSIQEKRPKPPKTAQKPPKKPLQITNNKNHINSIHSTLLKNPSINFSKWY